MATGAGSWGSFRVLAAKACVSASALLLVSQVDAENLVVNGGLEDTTFSSSSAYYPGSYRSATVPTTSELGIAELPGWKRVYSFRSSNAPIGFPPSTYYYFPGIYLARNDDPLFEDTPFGSQSGYTADLFQVIGGLIPGQEYQVSGSAIVYSPSSYAGYSNTFRLTVYDDFDGVVDANLAPLTYIAPTIPSIAQMELSSASQSADIGSPDWRDLSFSFVAPADGEVSLRVEKSSTVRAGACYWDNISMVAVPEPSFALLSGIGGLAMMFQRRRRRTTG